MAERSKTKARFKLQGILLAAARCGHKLAAERALEALNSYAALDEEHPLDFCDMEVCENTDQSK